MPRQKHPIAELAKAANETYLTAYRIGYEAGWEAACQAMLKSLKEPPMKGATIPKEGEG